MAEAGKEEREEKERGAKGKGKAGGRGEGGGGSEERKEVEASEEQVEEEERGGKERGREEEAADREAKPESEEGKRREPGDNAEATETTVEGATVITRRWSVPRETLRVRPMPELREPPTLETPDLATYDTRTDTEGGGGDILLNRWQHHTRGFSIRRLYRRNRS